MSAAEEHCFSLRLPRQVLSPETPKANIGAQVGIVRATTCPRRIVSGCSSAKITLLPKYGFSTCSGLCRTSVYLGGSLPSIGRRIPIRACGGLPRKSLKKLISSFVVLVSFFEGRASVIDQATILPSKGASKGRGTPPAITWKPLTWPSTRQGMTSTPATILPGQEGGGGVAVWPRTTTRGGAESASPGPKSAMAMAASRQTSWPAIGRGGGRGPGFVGFGH